MSEKEIWQNVIAFITKSTFSFKALILVLLSIWIIDNGEKGFVEEAF